VGESAWNTVLRYHVDIYFIHFVASRREYETVARLEVNEEKWTDAVAAYQRNMIFKGGRDGALADLNPWSRGSWSPLYREPDKHFHLSQDSVVRANYERLSGLYRDVLNERRVKEFDRLRQSLRLARKVPSQKLVGLALQLGIVSQSVTAKRVAQIFASDKLLPTSVEMGMALYDQGLPRVELQQGPVRFPSEPAPASESQPIIRLNKFLDQLLNPVLHYRPHARRGLGVQLVLLSQGTESQGRG
jgi:hypothetical protein